MFYIKRAERAVSRRPGREDELTRAHKFAGGSELAQSSSVFLRGTWDDQESLLGRLKEVIEVDGLKSWLMEDVGVGESVIH